MVKTGKTRQPSLRCVRGSCLYSTGGPSEGEIQQQQRRPGTYLGPHAYTSLEPFLNYLLYDALPRPGLAGVPTRVWADFHTR